jgi:RNA 3'-terminal phosphate cyclase (ATP)
MFITIDGSQGEGGGQILRSALSLSVVTGKPFVMKNIRARRSKPGLMRQHLTCVKAAAEISDAHVEGAEIGSTQLRFEPDIVRPGDFVFNIGSAGSTTLVLQTVLMPLLLSGTSSRVVLQGGTHNSAAPPFEFLTRAFLPLLRRIGFSAHVELQRPGFYPAGGGEISVEIGTTEDFRPLLIEERGALIEQKAEAIVSNLPFHIAERELAQLRAALGWPEDCLKGFTDKRAVGPGNILLLTLSFEHVTEVISSFGRMGASAETVAKEAAKTANAYLKADAPVGEHLADQLLLPMALGAGGRFVMGKPSTHTLTNIDVIQSFVDTEIKVKTVGDGVWEVTIADAMGAR